MHLHLLLIEQTMPSLGRIGMHTSEIPFVPPMGTRSRVCEVHLNKQRLSTFLLMHLVILMEVYYGHTILTPQTRSGKTMGTRLGLERHPRMRTGLVESLIRLVDYLVVSSDGSWGDTVNIGRGKNYSVCI